MPKEPYSELFRGQVGNRLGPPGLTVSNTAGEKATIRIYDEISWWGVTAEDVASTLEEITASEIEVQLSSLGGDVFEGVAIYNALRAHPARVTVRVDSIAASIASVIVQAGDHRVMLSSAQLMIHEAWGFAIGTSDDMRKRADTLDKQTDIIAGIYAERTDGDVADFRALMEAETWFTDEEAVAAGLADEVVKPAVQPAPADKTDRKFSAHAASVITDVEALIERAEEVVAFRTSQGKPPLSEDAVAAFGRLEAASRRLDDVITPETQTDIDDEVGREYVRFVELTQEP